MCRKTVKDNQKNQTLIFWLTEKLSIHVTLTKVCEQLTNIKIIKYLNNQKNQTLFDLLILRLLLLHV